MSSLIWFVLEPLSDCTGVTERAEVEVGRLGGDRGRLMNFHSSNYGLCEMCR